MAELSQNKLKYITSLHLKKNREDKGVFIAEGLKVINDLVKFGFIPQLIAYNPNIWDLKVFDQSHSSCQYYTTTNEQDNKMSLLSTAPGVIAIFPKPVIDFDKNVLKTTYVFLLDTINDPGNLGTIIRTAHWYGIHDIFISIGSVEIFSPKVVQSSMGSLAAVRIHIVENESFKSELIKSGVPIYYADMKGINIKSFKLEKPACIVFGNESNGISDFWKEAATMSLAIIPKQFNNHPESLNLATCTTIFMELLTMTSSNNH